MAGNTQTCSFTVTVNDNLNPEITCPANETLPVDNNCNILLPDYTNDAIVSDNCSMESNITVTQSPAENTTVSGHGTTQTVALTAEDENGNTRQCSFVVTLSDTTAPSLTCPADKTVLTDNSCQYTLSNYVSEATANDNCTASGNISLTQSPSAGLVLTGANITQTVTITATDDADNSVICTFTITTEDNTAPTITCPDVQNVSSDAACEATVADFTGLAVANDACLTATPVVVTQSPAVGTTLDGTVDMYTITLTAADSTGNTANCSFVLMVNDVLPPTVTCPTVSDIVLDGNCEAMLGDYTGDAVVDDNCSTTMNISVTQSPAPGFLLENHNTTQTVTLTATDEKGNSGQCTFEVSVLDETAPTIACPADLTINAEDTCPVSLTDYTGSATLSDNCGTAATNLSITQSPAAGTVLTGDGTVQNVVLTVTDAGNNTANCNFNVTLQDMNAPMISCPGNKVEDIVTGCSFDLADYTSEVNVTNGCMMSGGITLSQSPAVGTTLIGAGTMQTVTVTADDGVNTADCTFTVTLNDATPPSIVCPDNQTEFLDANCAFTIGNYPATSVSDNCTASNSISVSQSPDAGSEFFNHNNTLTVTLTADDGNDNPAQCTFSVTLLDNTPPAVICPADVTIDVNNDCEISMSDYTGDATVTDNCGTNPFMVTQSPNEGTMITGHNTTQTVTLTAKDGNGNSADCTFTVTLQDNATPEITCPADKEITVDTDCEISLADYTGSATVNDNCRPGSGISVTQSPSAGMSFSGHDTEITVTLTADDGNGNTENCTFNVTLKDEEIPTLTCPGDVTLTLNESCQIALPDYTTAASASDNCTADNDISLSQMPAVGSILSNHGLSQTVTITANDGNDNSTSCAFNIYLNDETAPVITCPDAQIQAVNADCQVSIGDYTMSAAATDNCTLSNDISITQSPSAGTTLNGTGTTQTITLTANDGNGNTANCSFVLTTEDNIAPSITCPDDVVTAVDAACMATLSDYTSAAAKSDNCTAEADITVSQSPAAGTTLTGANTTQIVTLTADDSNGNTTNCTFNVSTTDNIAPTVTCPNNLTVDADDNCQFILQDYTSDVTVSDNCSSSAAVTLSQSPVAGTTIGGNNTIQTITITAVDENLNSATCTFNVTLDDNETPSISCPDDITVSVDSDCMFTVLDYTDLGTVSDNCTDPGAINIEQFPASGTMVTGHGTEQYIVLRAHDGNGNNMHCDFLITLEDDTPPTLTCPANQIIETDDGCVVALPDYLGSATASDNCSDNASVNLSQSPAPGAEYTGDGTQISVIILAEDEAENITTCSFTVQLQDTTAPTLSCPGGQNITVDEECRVALPDYTDDIEVMNNCMMEAAQIDLSQSPLSGTILTGHATTQTVTITAVDVNGNQQNCSFVVTLFDDAAPDLTCPANLNLRSE